MNDYKEQVKNVFKFFVYDCGGEYTRICGNIKTFKTESHSFLIYEIHIMIPVLELLVD